MEIGICLIMQLLVPHDHLVGVGATGVCGDEGGGALFAVPREMALLRGAAHGQGINAVDVPVAVAVVSPVAAVS